MLHVDKLERKNRTCNQMRGILSCFILKERQRYSDVRCGGALTNYAALCYFSLAGLRKRQIEALGWGEQTCTGN